MTVSKRFIQFSCRTPSIQSHPLGGSGEPTVRSFSTAPHPVVHKRHLRRKKDNDREGTMVWPVQWPFLWRDSLETPGAVGKSQINCDEFSRITQTPSPFTQPTGRGTAGAAWTPRAQQLYTVNTYNQEGRPAPSPAGTGGEAGAPCLQVSASSSALFQAALAELLRRPTNRISFSSFTKDLRATFK